MTNNHSKLLWKILINCPTIRSTQCVFTIFSLLILFMVLLNNSLLEQYIEQKCRNANIGLLTGRSKLSSLIQSTSTTRQRAPIELISAIKNHSKGEPLTSESIRHSNGTSTQVLTNGSNTQFDNGFMIRRATIRGAPFDKRCREIRRRVSWGVKDYVMWDGDGELKTLMQPLFKNKRLVVWSLDHHIGPISDLRSLIEPLGVEFIERTMYHRCNFMCSCANLKLLHPFTWKIMLEPSEKFFDHLRSHPILGPEMARADAFLVAHSSYMIELFRRLNRSIISVHSIHYEWNLGKDVSKWREFNGHLRALMTDPRHVIGANNLFDVEYMHYFLGLRPDYIPSFCGYTGEHYRPTRRSFLFSRPVYNLPVALTDSFKRHYQQIKASFVLHDLLRVYRGSFNALKHSYFDISSHLGIIHYPYQVWLFLMPQVQNILYMFVTELYL